MGIFGVASSAVAQRTKELGIRRALGANAWSLIRESLRETLVVFGIGLVVGSLGAVVGVRAGATAIADLLFGRTATDAANVVMAVGVMGTAALVACLMPAYRATRVDALISLKEE